MPGGGVLEQELKSLGVTIHPLEFGKYSLRQNPLWHVVFYRRFRQILKACKPDVVVINLSGNTPLVTLAAVRTRIPIIRFSRFEFKAPTRWLDRWCWLKAGAIICPSEMVKQQVLAWAPTELHSRVHCFYDAYAGRAATAQEAAAFRREFRLGEDKIIGCVGRLHRSKRIETAIKALAEVRKKLMNARLLIIGGAGSPDEKAYRGELQQLAIDLGVQGAVTFIGFRPAEDMPAAIAALSVCVLPSESESFGMVLMEAWSQGVPTVASNVGGCCEITQASGGGYLVPVGDHHAMARLIGDLVMRPDLSRKLGVAGQAWAKANCDPKVYVNRFSTLLDSVLKLSRSDSYAN